MEAVSLPRTERGNRQLSLECGSVNGACLSLRALMSAWKKPTTTAGLEIKVGISAHCGWLAYGYGIWDSV